MEQTNNLTECMCEFCGQILQVDEETMSQAKQDIKIAGKLVCDCTEAKRFQWSFAATEKGINIVDNICGRSSVNPLEPEVVNILHRGVSEIVRHHMTSICINVSGKEKVELKLGKKGIKCNRTVKETREDECIFP